MKKVFLNRTLSITENSSLHANRVSPHNCVAYVDFDGNIDKKIFMLALAYIKDTFPCLTSRIDVHATKNIKIISDGDFIHFSQNIVDEKYDFDSFFEREINSPFNLYESPLIRITHLKSIDNNRLIITMHHIICDGISLAYFVGFLFDTIESLLSSRQLISMKIESRKIEELVNLDNIEPDLNRVIPDKRNIYMEKQSFLPGYTKAFTFEMKRPNNYDKKGISIHYLILAAASITLKEILPNINEINYIIPINMRPYSINKISNYELGFYSSWIEFNALIQQVDQGIDLASRLKMKTQNSIGNKEHFSNLVSLNKMILSHQPEGIIKNILTSNRPSVCVSNVGKIEIKTSYAEGYIRIKSMHLGLNSYYRTDNSFLLIVTGIGQKICFSFLYSYPHMSQEKAAEYVKHIKIQLQGFFKPISHLCCNLIDS